MGQPGVGLEREKEKVFPRKILFHFLFSNLSQNSNEFEFLTLNNLALHSTKIMYFSLNAINHVSKPYS